MATSTRVLLAIMCGLLLVAPSSRPAARAAAPAQAQVVEAAGAAPSAPASIPLLGCGDTMAVNEGEPACCIVGEVVIEGQPVAGAKVIISNSKGAVELYTEDHQNSTTPYFRTSLSSPPLLAQTGETITLTADAADADGSIVRVEVLADGVEIGEDTTAPYTYAWSGAPVGSPRCFNHTGPLGSRCTGTGLIGSPRLHPVPFGSIGMVGPGSETRLPTPCPSAACAAARPIEATTDTWIMLGTLIGLLLSRSL